MRIFESKVDTKSRKAMIDFLTGHFRYWTGNSWNRLSSYANNVKLYNLHLPKEIEDKAYEVICGEVDSDLSFYIDNLIADFTTETGYTACFNGRSNGYLVMYDCERKLDEHKSYCPYCGQRNFQLATPDNNKCGVCGQERRNYEKPLYYYQTKWSNVGSDDPGDYEDDRIETLREKTKLVQRFDRLCDDIRDKLIYVIKNGNIEEEEYTVTKIRKVLREA